MSAPGGKRPAEAGSHDPLDGFFYHPDEELGGLAVEFPEPEDVLGVAEVPVARQDRDYLSFFLGDELYALPISALREIVRPLPITEVPRTPAWVLGVITLRGTVLPVMDLRLRLGLPIRDMGRPARFLVVDTEEGPAGLITDRVGRVVRDDLGILEPPPQALGGGAAFIEGILRHEGELLIILDYEAALHVAAGEARRPREGA